ncbi:MAG: nucleotidyltransferase domain-containing protein [Candidatus Sericytochromatia bacterium]
MAALRRVLAAYPQIEQAILFGSRAKGTHQPGSDIDLALVGVEPVRFPLWRLASDIDDLLLPYKLDLLCLSELDQPELRSHIQRVGLTLYARTEQTVPDQYKSEGQ